MYFRNKVPQFAGKYQEIDDPKLKEIISYSLHQDFGDQPHKIKNIGGNIQAGIQTIKGWYYGRKVPNCLYFIQLVKISPTLKYWLMIYVFGEEFWDDYRLIEEIRNNRKGPVKTPSAQSGNKQNHDPINEPINLNEAQKWFLMTLKSGRNIGAEDIVKRFDVSRSTAKRYIKEMREKSLIRFIGSNKNGRYEIDDDID